MKKMGKVVLSVVLVLSMLLCFAACSKGGQTGRYELTSMEEDGQEFNIADMKEFLGDDYEAYIELKGNGKAVMNMMGEVEDLVYKDGYMWPEGDEDDKIAYKISGNTLTLEQDGMKMVFKKK